MDSFFLVPLTFKSQQIIKWNRYAITEKRGNHKFTHVPPSNESQRFFFPSTDGRMLRSAHFSCLSVDVSLLSARRAVSNPEILKKEHYFADSSRIIQKTDASEVCCG